MGEIEQNSNVQNGRCADSFYECHHLAIVYHRNSSHRLQMPITVLSITDFIDATPQMA